MLYYEGKVVFIDAHDELVSATTLVATNASKIQDVISNLVAFENTLDASANVFLDEVRNELRENRNQLVQSHKAILDAISLVKKSTRCRYL